MGEGLIRDLLKEVQNYSFQSFFEKETKKTIIEIPWCPSNIVNGAKELFDLLQEMREEKDFELRKISCIGRCDKPIVLRINGVIHESMNKEKILKLMEEK